MRVAETQPIDPMPAPAKDSSPRRVSARAGFSLVEVVIALLVMVVGLLGILALFPVGLDSSRDARDNTHAAQFASRVFNGILAQTMANPQLWSNIYDVAIGAKTNALRVSYEPIAESGVPSDNLWANQPNLSIWLGGTTTVYTHTFVVNDDPTVTEYAYRYKLSVAATVPMRWDKRYGVSEGLAEWQPDKWWNYDFERWETNMIKRWWVCPTLYNSDELKYRRHILRLTLEVLPELYGTRNARTFYCYLPKLM